MPQPGGSTMDFGLSEEQEQLKASARAFLAAKCTTAYVRKVAASEDGLAPELYAEIAKLGWNGLVVPETYGGAGLSILDMAALVEEEGYAAMPGPFLFSSLVAAYALKEFGSEELRRRWLPAIAEGKALGTVAIMEADDGLEPASIAARARRLGGEVVLEGRKMFAAYADSADFLLVAARLGDAAEDVAFFLVETGTPGLSVRAMKTLDLTRRVSVVELGGVRVGSSAQLEGGVDALRRIVDVGAVGIAADSLGGAQRALEMAVEYSKVREQFGRPIGSFQALKHLAAEMVSEIEPARSLLWYAAYAMDAAPAQAARAAAMAKARLGDVYSRTTDRAVLMHGGIGFTWEHDIHLWFKRAHFNESYFGAPAWHRERVAALGAY
jgi:alkylation response protein AidB-like acyl-CoA dehydrogenase